jgi:hypothetical protein
MAKPLPQNIALERWDCGKELATKAMTTALSPDRIMLIQMIWQRARKKATDKISTRNPSG